MKATQDFIDLVSFWFFIILFSLVLYQVPLNADFRATAARLKSLLQPIEEDETGFVSLELEEKMQ